MDIGGVHPIAPEPRDPKTVRRATEKDAVSKSEASGLSSSLAKADSGNDTVSISPQAKTAHDKLQLSEKVKDLPDIRKNEVEQAKTDLENGKFFTEDIVKDTAEQILKRF